MVNLNKITLPIILILVGIILFQRSCLRTQCPEATVIIKHDTIRDTHHDTVYKADPNIYYADILPESKPVIKHDTVYKVTQEQIDTTSVQDVIMDWYTTRIYTDTNKSQYGTFYISDTLQKNKIQGRRIIADWNVPTAINNTTQVIPQKLQLYIGGSLGSSGKTIGFGPDLLLKTKKDQIYSIGASYIPDVGTYYHGSIFWKIHF